MGAGDSNPPPKNGARAAQDAGPVDELLRARADLEDSLRRYQRFCAVLFTDIEGSTEYFTRKGDLAGRLLVQRHDDLLFPVVEEHGGRVVKTTGDGMLAAFDEPIQATRAAVAMQRTVQAANLAERDAGDELHIHIAIHAGVGFHDRHDIYGNLVNIAARVEKLAGRDQILMTEVVFRALDGPLEAWAHAAGEHTLKGIDEPLRLYEFDWRGRAVEAGDASGRAGAGEATILAADIEGSAALWEHEPKVMRAVHDRYENIVRDAVGGHGGEIVKVVGDAISAAVPEPAAAIRAAAEIQQAVAAMEWSRLGVGSEPLTVRIGLHTGRAALSDGTYAGQAVARATRLNAIGHGGQILLTGAVEVRVRGHLPAGFEVYDHGGHRLPGMGGIEQVFEVGQAGVPTARRALRSDGTRHPSQRVHIGERDGATAGADTAPVSDIWAALRHTACDESGAVSLTPAEVRAILHHRPNTLEEYWLGRLVEWSQPRYRLDSRFVQLSMLVDRGEERDERWQVTERHIDDLGELLSEVNEPAMVILAPPGSGKSTLLRRLELDAATAAVRGGPPRVSFFVQLNDFRPGDDGVFPAPGPWLSERWRSRYPALPGLDELLAEGRMLLLLDGLNEIPSATEADFRHCVRLWKDFVGETVRTGHSWDGAGGNRFVFSCRSLDYSAPLSSPTLRVPQVRIEPMDDNQIRQYLKLFCPAQWAEVWQAFAGSANLDLLRTPYFLRLTVEQILEEGRTPQGRAELFTGFVRNALRREVERDSPLFDDEELLSSRDRRQIVRWRWKGPYDLPERGLLVRGLGQLAHRMQESLSASAGAQVRVDIDDAVDMLGHERGEDLLRAGEALAILDEDPASDEILFVHQLVQEYFAARELSRAPRPALVRAPWRKDEVRPSLADTLHGLAPADPLPPLPSTGWEETSLLAAAMAPTPDAFVAALAPVNLVLAGRCAAQRELEGRLSADLIEDLRAQLATRMRAPDADLRARIAAGLTLGTLGGPRYERRRGPHGDYLLPPLVPIPGGRYRIGSDAPYDYRGRTFTEELPACEVTLAPFAIAAFAVTNAEWAYFMAGGGYQDERFWVGRQDKAWLHGTGTADNLRNVARYWRKRFQDEPALIHKEVESARMERSNYELWRRRLSMSDEAFERHLEEYYPARRETEPRHWRSVRFNNPMQPVIGISVFEARAFARWLAEQSGLSIRLPSEVEWEAAARGHEGRIYAYGNEFDPTKGNTLETHIRQPAPVGVFPEGDTPEGVADLTGNTFDYTCSLWGADPFVPDYAYPYDPTDGREDPDAPVSIARIGRGGSWYVASVHARTAYRGRDRYDLRPDDWLTYRGCRMAMSGHG
ncbi:SUMF1/EgtB/PvdO family nonheme iron enzyme [Haliangium sp.]|uniref:SUMF1/EgtB/PvdO family nonheme iron enzyme n=1 Tax=Haliangium sp. TaxID=2663208 RepID=UPI003D09C842